MHERIKYEVFSLPYKSLKTAGQPSYLHSLLSFPSHRSNRLLFLSPLVAFLSPLVLKLQTNLSIILLLFFSSLPSRYVAHYVTPSPILNSPVSDTSTLSLFISSLVCIHLDYLRTDISGINQASLFHIILILLSFTLVSFMPILILFDLCLWINSH